jgi:membrane-associated phospholipid phosphatase
MPAMHWLLTLDTGLFHFINRSLSNPLFDWLMPVLSGGGNVMRWFLLAAVIAFVAALVCGPRARLCALLLALALILGDSLVVNTIKHAVARPRPFVTLPDARVFGVVGQGYVPPEAMAANTNGLNSLPSAHAANWFAATMILFLYYRKSWRFMLPMALAVSFSRIYNGVHYPSDVLAGSILGAGYAAGGVIALQAAWNWLGKRWFPLWHAKMPSLINPVQSPESPIHSSGLDADSNSSIGNRQSATENPIPAQPSTLNHQPSTDSHWLRLGYVLIILMLVGRWLYLASGTIELSQDEAYQWVWSKHPALSYYSKPPGIAFIQLAGTSLFGDSAFGVRFFSPLFAAITSLMLLRFLAREAGARPSFWLLLAATATPLLGLGTILMTIDPPLVLCWTWAMLAGWRAMQPDGKTRDWLIVGLAMGLGFLCKYTALYELLCFVIFFVFWPPARIHLRKAGPWLALLVIAFCTLPVVIWNARHGWITIHHVAGNAGLNGQWHPTLRHFTDFVLQEFGLLNPVFFIGALWAMIAFWKFRRERPLWLYLFCLGAPVFLGHLLYSLHSRILPNWIAPAILPMFCLMVVFWDEKIRNGSRWVKPVLAAGLTLGLAAIAIMYQSNFIGRLAGAPLPGEKDPLRRVRAWTVEARLVEAERAKLQTPDRPAFIICSHYGITGLYSFYIPQAHDALKTKPVVYYESSDTPENQFYFWPEYNYLNQRKGQNAIFVSRADLYVLEKGWVWKWLAHEPLAFTTPPPGTLPARIAGEFESVTDLGEQDVKLGDRVIDRIHLWACHNLK